MTDKDLELMIITSPTDTFTYIKELKKKIEIMEKQRNQALVVIARILDANQEFLPENCDG